MVETIKYEVIRKIGKVEVRRYPKIVVAKVEDPEADAFSLLYKFITGENAQRAKVKMTAPVVSQQIAMTSPVFTETGAMAFVMPQEFTLETIPQPLDNRVVITEIPERTVAVLRFSGGWSESHFEKETQELLEDLANAKSRLKDRYLRCSITPFYPRIYASK